MSMTIFSLLVFEFSHSHFHFHSHSHSHPHSHFHPHSPFLFLIPLRKYLSKILDKILINRVDIRCSCSPAKQGHFQAIVKDNVFVLYLHLTRGDVAVSPIRASKSELNKEFLKRIPKAFLSKSQLHEMI